MGPLGTTERPLGFALPKGPPCRSCDNQTGGTPKGHHREERREGCGLMAEGGQGCSKGLWRNAGAFWEGNDDPIPGIDVCRRLGKKQRFAVWAITPIHEMSILFLPGSGGLKALV